MMNEKKMAKLCFDANEDDLAAENADQGRRVYSVTELTQEIKNVLQNRFDLVWISGEISNFFRAASGHLYFDLKDANAQVKVVIFRGQAQRLTFDLEDGLSILAMGRISLYERRGTYQLIVEYVEPAGIGALQKQFEQLKKELHAEGLFDEQYKQDLPYLPNIIGIITSLQGAVIHDMRIIFKSRFNNCYLRIAPVAVQGENAPDEISEAVGLLNELPDTDLIIIARGGGSFEDLNAFNTEKVARSIFNSKIPIISAIGHETDYTIADFTADMRAPTPTAAAEMALPNKADLQYHLHDRRRNMLSDMRHQIESLRQSIDFISRRLKHPQDRLKQMQLRLDDLSGRLYRSNHNQVNQVKDRFRYLKLQLAQVTPQKQLDNAKQRHEIIDNKLLNNIDKICTRNRHQNHALTQALKAYNPMYVLKRGYSITRTVDVPPNLVTSAKSVAPLQTLEILLAQGQLTVEVKEN